MRESYFFRNVNNYEELVKKTKDAQKRLSKNKRKMEVLCRINLLADDFERISSDLKSECDIVIKHNKYMRIERGIWKCIELQSGKKSIIVMADGFPYPRFVALNGLDNI